MIRVNSLKIQDMISSVIIYKLKRLSIRDLLWLFISDLVILQWRYSLEILMIFENIKTLTKTNCTIIVTVLTYETILLTENFNNFVVKIFK